jgi:hypothetical protein
MHIAAEAAVLFHIGVEIKASGLTEIGRTWAAAEASGSALAASWTRR